MKTATASERCPWAIDDLYAAYHDTEWGVPLHEDRKLFEFIILEGAQAGLSWHTVLKKLEGTAGMDRGVRRLEQGFDPARIHIRRPDHLLRAHAGDRHGQ